MLGDRKRGENALILAALFFGRFIVPATAQSTVEPPKSPTPAAEVQPVAPKPPAPPRRPSPRPTPMRMEATVFEVSIPSSKILELNVDQLSESSNSTTELLSALSKIGTARPVFHIDQVADLMTGDEAGVSVNVPFPTGVTRSAAGAEPSVYGRHEVGVDFRLNGIRDEASPITTHVRIGLSISGVAAGTSIAGPTIHKVKQNYTGALPVARPILLLSLDVAAPGDTATAYLTRIHLRDPTATGPVPASIKKSEPD